MPSRSIGTSRLGSSASSNSRSTISVGTNSSPSRRRCSLCSSSTCSRNRSNILASFFIRLM
uniref:Uncharacterized protein n=1 Tax=Arundo donax TaxID=35708 RepID=A0A0A8Z205_ARUDO